MQNEVNKLFDRRRRDSLETDICFKGDLGLLSYIYDLVVSSLTSMVHTSQGNIDTLFGKEMRQSYLSVIQYDFQTSTAFQRLNFELSTL